MANFDEYHDSTDFEDSVNIRRLDNAVEDLEWTQDGSPSGFKLVADLLFEAEGFLEQATGYDGMGGVRDAIEEWDGGAAGNFRNYVLNDFDCIVANQAKLTKEIAYAALGNREILDTARAHTLELATNLRRKLANSGHRIDLGTVLWIVGAVASAVGLGAAAWAARSRRTRRSPPPWKVSSKTSTILSTRNSRTCRLAWEAERRGIIAPQLLPYEKQTSSSLSPGAGSTCRWRHRSLRGRRPDARVRPVRK